MPGITRFTISALGVGHGDALLLRWEDPKEPWTCLVDGGEKPADLRKTLSRRGIEKIDLLVLSHFDVDHVNGLLGLAGHVKISEYWGPATRAYLRHLWIFGSGCRKAIERTQRLEEELQASGTTVSYPLEGYASAPRGSSGPRLEVLSPPGRLVETLLTADDVTWLFTPPQTPLGWLLEPEPTVQEELAVRRLLEPALRRSVLQPGDVPAERFPATDGAASADLAAGSAEPEFFGDEVLNNSSLVLWVEVPVGGRLHRVLLTGDQENWVYLCGRHPRGLHADLLKAAHHGGRVYLGDQVSYGEVMKTVRPRTVLVSACGRHHLPRADFRTAAANWGATIFCTSERCREVVISSSGSGHKSCHRAFGCSRKTRDVTIVFDGSGVWSETPACHSGWGGETGPVIQLQQYIVAPSAVTQRLMENELRRHLKWAATELRKIDRERRDRATARWTGYLPISSRELVNAARAERPPRHDLVANMATVMAEGMNRQTFWVEDLSPHHREWSVYAWPKWRDVKAILRILNGGPPLLLEFPPNGERYDPKTIVSTLDQTRFEALGEQELCLPARAFRDTIWPAVRHNFVRRWHGYLTVERKLVLSPDRDLSPTFRGLYARFVAWSDDWPRIAPAGGPPDSRWRLLFNGSPLSDQWEGDLRGLLMSTLSESELAPKWAEVVSDAKAEQISWLNDLAAKEVALAADYLQSNPAGGDKIDEIQRQFRSATWSIGKHPEDEQPELTRFRRVLEDKLKVEVSIKTGWIDKETAFRSLGRNVDRFADLMCEQLVRLW